MRAELAVIGTNERSELRYVLLGILGKTDKVLKIVKARPMTKATGGV